jgi:hypothetical protein
MDTKVLASSSTEEGLLKLIREYYMGTLYQILEDGRLQRISDGGILYGVKVIRKKNRFQFVSY